MRIEYSKSVDVLYITPNDGVQLPKRERKSTATPCSVAIRSGSISSATLASCLVRRWFVKERSNRCEKLLRRLVPEVSAIFQYNGPDFG